MKVPNPGSDEARKQFCLCPILDNEHGLGYMFIEDMFVIVKGCPLHDPEGKIGEE